MPRKNTIPKELPLDSVKTPANAVILRLGDTVALTQDATIKTVLAHHARQGLWFPCGSNANFSLCSNLASVGGRFFLAWGNALKIQAVVTECKALKSPVGYPGDGPNPWPDAAFPCRRWLRISNAKEIDCNEFYVARGDSWSKGVGEGQTALLWAVVPE
jgi:hypothetical protein